MKTKTTPFIEYEEVLDIKTVIREEFDENDFWENKTLKKQLVNEHELLFRKKMENNFYKLFMMYLDDYPNMFENLDFDEMFNILYSCVIKNYNIEKLYDDYENTADILLEQYKKESCTKVKQEKHNTKTTILKMNSSNTCKKNTSWANLVKN